FVVSQILLWLSLNLYLQGHVQQLVTITGEEKYKVFFFSFLFHEKHGCTSTMLCLSMNEH
ncbi:TPA: hypothetical protein ACIEOW_004731, partial [Escherichia coli]